jgi:hypothetical protein
MNDTATLPPEYADLQPFMAQWCLTNERDRYFKLIGSSIPELQRFFDAITPRSDEIAARLNPLDVATLTPEDRNLFWLLMTYVETAHPIELKWKKTDVEDSFAPERLQFGPSSCESPI